MQNTHTRRALIATACLTLALMVLCPLAPGIANAAGSKQDVPAAGQIDINNANAEQLTVIPGIGKVMAERIVQFRDQNGSFKRIEDLLKIKGIGEKSFQKIRPYVKIGKSN
jgi:competence protein ComEA